MSKYIVVVYIVLCATIGDDLTYDRYLTSRLAVWSICLILLTKRFTVPKSPILLCLAGYTIWSVISLTNAMSPIEGVFEVCRNILMVMTLCVFTGIKDKSFIIKTLTLTAIGLACYGIYEFSGDIASNEYVGLMGCRNPWSACQLLLVPFCVYNLRYWKKTSILAIVLISINMAFLFNRASIVAIVVAGFILCLRNKKMRIPAIIIVLVVLCIFSSLDLSRLTDTTSLKVRIELWRATLGMVGEFPIRGCGLGGWAFEIPRYAAGIDLPGFCVKVVYQRPHNDYLWVMSETGLIGFLLYIGMFISALWCTRKNLIVSSGIIMYMVIAFFSFPKERAFMCLLLVVYLSFVECKQFRIKYIPMLLSIVICGWLCACHVGERHISKAVFYTKYRQHEKVLKEVSLCNFTNPIALTGIPVEWYASNANLHLGNYDEAYKQNLIAFKKNPNNIYVLDRMGTFFAGAGKFDDSRECFNRVQSMVPDFRKPK